MKLIRIFAFTLLFAFISISANFSVAEEFAPLFPFAISHNAPDNIVNVMTWNDNSETERHTPAGKFGIIRIENGHFVHNKGRFLIWGTNLCGSANFPEKEEAEQLAARLARFGINCVRLHHMDNSEMWGGSSAKTKLTIDPAKLDKLDYLIYQFKLRGIYTNINLHVSRTLDERDGFTGSDKRPQFDKGLDNFYRPFIEAQKKYARDLLTHINPYTKNAYINEPAVAVVEINNENSCVSQWTWGNALMSLPEPYSTEFRKLWNDFLRKKYKNTEELSKTWGCISEPLSNEMFTQQLESQKWNVEIDSETKCKKIQNGDIMRLEVEKIGKEYWHPQLIANNLSFKKGKLYTFSIKVKTDKPTELTIQARMSHDPWSSLGFNSRIKAEKEWTTITAAFIPNTDDDKARFDISNFSPGIFEFSDASLKQGGEYGLKKEHNIENGTVPLVNRSGISEYGDGLPQNALNDFCDFILETERNYWLEMYNYLKNDLKVQQPVSGTQMRYGSMHTQTKLDYIDNHSYWNHPGFPGRQWDQNNWYIRNRALTDAVDTDILPLLGTARVNGLPYTVSEFDAPMPNQYAAEALPILASFGRFQDWDGFFHFAYSHNRLSFGANKATSFFDMVGNTVKLAHQPACYALFRRGDITEGKTLIYGGLDEKKENELFKKDRSTAFTFKSIDFDQRLTLLYRTALDAKGKSSGNIPSVKDAQNNIFRYKSETGQIYGSLNKEKKETGEYLADTPNTKLFTGFTKTDKEADFSDVKLTFTGKNRSNWATVSLVSVNGNGFVPSKSNGKPVKILVTATGWYQNTDMIIEKLDGDKITFGNRWGKEPSLCEGIPFALQFKGAKNIHVAPLDENGDKRGEVKSSAGRCELGPQYKTIWYEITLN
ncbi:hypothetical protein FACS18942_04330 [Planctomycetales bacterium]|nr:hypothetical protein FACS18942_04330 [Planctomycetales bacterium]